MVGTLAHSQRWRLRARCIGYTEDLWYGPDKESALAWENRTKAAKDICASCDVRTNCLTYALDNQEVYGIWGGTTPWERLKTLQKRGVTASNPERYRHLVCSAGHLRRPDTVYHGPRYSTCRVCRELSKHLRQPTLAKDKTAYGAEGALQKVALKFPVEIYPELVAPSSESSHSAEVP